MKSKLTENTGKESLLMPDVKEITLSRMEVGQGGQVVEIQGGRNMIDRLDAMGIRTGKRVAKVSSMVMRGPVTVRVGNTQLAIGFGMARRIIVRLDE